MAAGVHLELIDGIVSALSQTLPTIPSLGGVVGLSASLRVGGPTNSPTTRSRYLEAKVPLYRAYIVGLHDRFIGVVQMDCVDDNSAIKSTMRLVDNHDVELWQMDRPVARFDAPSKQILNK
jgi:hypothetical protein